MKPNVAVVLPPREDFSPGGPGAISLIVHSLARSEAPGFTPIVLGPAARLPPFPHVAFQPVHLPWWLPGTRARRYAFGAAHIIAGLAPALIEVHNRPDVALFLACRFAAIPTVLFLHNDPRAMRGARSVLERQQLLGALARVVTVSEFLRGQLFEGLGDAAPAVVLPNPIECEAFSAALPAEAREQTVLFAGRVVADKGADAFVREVEAVLPKLAGWRAEMFGADRFGQASPDTNYIRALRRRARAGGIIWHGYRPREEVLAAMARAAIVVVPSRWPEPFGLTALEALAAGSALIAAPSGALPEIAGGAARYADPDAPGELAAAILRLAADLPARQALGAAGQARAREFDLPRIAARLTALRSEVLGS